MDTRTPTRHGGMRPARTSAAITLGAFAALTALPAMFAQAAPTTAQLQQATLLHTRITGVPPSAANLTAMANDLASGQPEAAAAIATAQPQFYNNTLKNIWLPATNVDQSVFVPLNDYVVTVI